MAAELFALKHELSRYTGIFTSKELRQSCKDATDSISALSLPISSIENPVVTCLHKIFSQFQERYAKSFVPILCDCIVNHVFSSNALTSVTSSLLLEINDSIEWQTVHSLMDFLQTSVLENFPDISVVQSYFSIVLQLMAHTNPNISGVSYASFQSMLDILVEAVNSYKKEDIPPAFLTICTDIFGMQPNQFEKPLYFILFLLFNDLSCISVGQKTRFLICHIVPKNVIFDVLEMILNDYRGLFTSCPQLASVFESTVIQSMSDFDSLPFIVAFIKTCYSSHLSLCSSLVNEYISKWKSETFSSLFLFYSLAIAKNNEIPLFIFRNQQYEGLNLFTLLFIYIHSFIDFKKIPSQAIEFIVKPKSFKRVMSEQELFIESAPFETVFCIIRSFITFFNNHRKDDLNAQKDFEKFADLFQRTGDVLKEIYFYALKYSAISTFDIATKSFVKFLSESAVKFDNLETLINFDVLCESQSMNEQERKLFSIHEKKLRWDQVLNRIAIDCPNVCSDNWYLLFASLFASDEDTVALSPSFAKTFSDEETENVLKSLIDVRPFPHTFINDFLISNIFRFEKLWPILDKFFDTEIGRNSRIDDKIFDLFIDLIQKDFVEQTEAHLLELGAKILKSTKSVSIEKKVIVLKELRSVFAEHSQELKNGYPFLFEILDPEMYNDELLTSAYQLFSVICSDYIHTTDPIFVRPCLELIFKYAQQTKDINVSLSSFDLIWNVVNAMEKNDDNWTHFLFKLSDLFFDDRSDIAHCAVKTFFTYLTSNFVQISEKTINYFLNKGFQNIVNRFDFNDQRSLSILQQILYEISHLFITFWTDFTNKDIKFEFYSNKNEEMIMKCENNEVIVASYQFYDRIATSGIQDINLHKMVAESLTRLAENKFASFPDVNSSVVSQFGRIIGIILKSFPKRNYEHDHTPHEFSEIDKVAFSKYIELSKNIADHFPTGDFIHITTQKILDAVAAIIPILPNDQREECLQLYKYVYAKNDEKLKVAICRELNDVFDSFSLPACRCESNESQSLEETAEVSEELIKNSINTEEMLANKRTWLVLNCQEEILSGLDMKLIKKILDKKLNWPKCSIDDLNQLFEQIKGKFPQFADLVNERNQNTQ